MKSNIREKITKPIRMSIDSCYECNLHNKKGNILAGRIEGGVIKKGEKMIVKPINLEVLVKEIQVNDKPTHIAYPGDICDLTVTLKKEKDWQNVQKGCFLSAPKFHVPSTHRFVAKIVLFELKSHILIGTRVNLHLCGFVEGGIISKLNYVVDPSDETVAKKNPRFLTSGQHAQVEITADHEICLELYENFQSLGRFQFRDRGRSLGEGRVIKILK